MGMFWIQFILAEALAVLSTLATMGVIPPEVLRVLAAIDAALDQIPKVDPAPPTPPAA